VRAADLHGKGFGQDPNDSASLVLMELDTGDNPTVILGSAELKKAGSYTKISCAVSTRKTTSKVRFILGTALRCPYTEGHVTYDDCDFRLGHSSPTSGP
jgi:hypothetical protein